MANLLNEILLNPSLNNSANEPATSFTFDTTGKVKPLQDKATLLPSRIIGSPFAYLGDLKKDVVSIGKAAQGKANDHELGRINDFAMKLGSLGIAGYLFAKNPLKLSKGMELAGFASFFASMALWPKLAIQAPLKARTGVDFQQEYIDSQGRKKMLYQDPQYVLTDLLPREDLDNIGKKMEVDENLPDRDSFIKQRAHKTAIQANTLWMMTAGVATPVMSALMCNSIEKFLKPRIEARDLKNTREELYRNFETNEALKEKKKAALDKFSAFIDKNKEKNLDKSMIENIKKEFGILAKGIGGIQNNSEEQFAKFLENNKNNPINEKMIENMANEIGSIFDGIKLKNNVHLDKFGAFIEQNKDKPLDSKTIERIANEFDVLFEDAKVVELSKPLREQLKSLPAKEINIDTIKNVFGEDVVKNIPKGQMKALEKYINDFKTTPDKKIDKISSLLADSGALGEVSSKEAKAKLTQAVNVRTVGDARQSLGNLYEILVDFTENKKILDKYTDARIGDRSGSYIANQWERIGSKFLKALNIDSTFGTENLKKIAEGDTKLISQKLEELVEDENKFKKVVNDLMKMIDDYETLTKNDLMDEIKTHSTKRLTDFANEQTRIHPGEKVPPINKSYDVFDNARAQLASKNFVSLADKISLQGSSTKQPKSSVPGTLQHTYAKNAENRVLGAKASFYRMIQALDIFRQSQGKQNQEAPLKTKIAELFELETGKTASEDVKNKLAAKCKEVIMRATTVDHIEKFTSKGFELSEVEYKVVMKAIFDNKELSLIESCLRDKTSPFTKEEATTILDNFKEYKNAMMEDVINWQNEMRPDIQRRVVGAATSGKDGVRRNNLVGKTVNDLVKDLAKSNYNSKKWMLMFGGIMTGLTTFTLAAGTMLGGKSKIEEQAEEESRRNV